MTTANLRRRAVLLGAGGALSAGVIASAGSIARVAVAGPPLVSTYVAGLGYQAGIGRVRDLIVGDVLILRRAPHNDYDPRTIEVWTQDGVRLGNVPGVDTRVLAGLIDSGRTATGRVSAVLADGGEPEIRFDVHLA